MPMMIGIVSMVAFNLIDMFYVGQLGPDQLAALSFTFPVIMVVFSLVQGVGIGATALISRSIGAGNMDKARRETTDSLVLGLLLAMALFVIGMLSMESVFVAMGATEDVLPYILEYMEIWFITIVVIVVPFVGNSAIRSTGDAMTPTLIMLFAVAINAILDPLFIFGLGSFEGLGMKGAALATSVSRLMTLVLSLYILYKKKQLITLEIPPFKVLTGCWKSIIYIGLPSGVARMLSPMAVAKVTAILSSYGAFAVAAFGIGSRIEFLTMSVLFALAASLGPFTGQNFGVKHFDRILKALNLSTRFSIAWGLAMAVLLYFFGSYAATFFSEEQEVLKVCALYLSIVPFSFGFQGVNQSVNAIINTLNKPFVAFVVSILVVVLMVVLSSYGSTLYGLDGVFYGLALTYLLTGIVSYVVGRVVLTRLEEAKSRQAIS